ncbi:uncharacterized protein LOC106166721 [Lingula anatina]|uniref:Uncharacterized protein LOC106166721 n=1 Tax=Lingula anatina TaxID=7574 RepID=A0A1S3ITG3_LINAN|nr:uncharacterized protein LOC106166721 [Lingula anatina]|eukprot:XP_013400819.1 uncharacterized protein LOC106166721 [Lingula anatina]
MCPTVYSPGRRQSTYSTNRESVYGGGTIVRRTNMSVSGENQLYGHRPGIQAVKASTNSTLYTEGIYGEGQRQQRHLVTRVYGDGIYEGKQGQRQDYGTISRNVTENIYEDSPLRLEFRRLSNIYGNGIYGGNYTRLITNMLSVIYSLTATENTAHKVQTQSAMYYCIREILNQELSTTHYITLCL